MLKVLGYFTHSILEKRVCLDYLCLNQEKLSNKDNMFKNTIFDYLTRIGVTDVLMNITKYRYFSREQQSI